MVTTVLIVVALLIAAILIVAARKPDVFRVERRTTIAAPPARIYPLVADLHAFQTWSPWAKLDPAMVATHGGPAAGVGASYHWRGDKKVGEGKMEIVEADPDKRVRIKLDFLKPFEAHNTTDFVLEPAGPGSTAVTWAMFGRQPFLMRLVCLVMNMDRMVGKDFEKGLAEMKRIAEERPALT